MRKILSFFSLMVFLFFYSCVGYRNFITVFEIDKNSGIFVPLSSPYQSIQADSTLIVRSTMNVYVEKVEYRNETIDIYLYNLPKIDYQFDSYVLYTSLFLSFFNSFPINKVNFLYKERMVLLKGIEYSMNHLDYYKYPINDLFNIGNVKKGKYFIYTYLSDHLGEKFIPVLLPSQSTMDFYFNQSVKEINKMNLNIKIETFDKLLNKREKIEMVNYKENHIIFRSYGFFTFLKLYLDKSKLYFLFYNSDLELIFVYQKVLWFDLKLKINRPEKLYLNRYPLNLK
ncbi:MAG: hypothetical protein N2169_04000 [bacterium]|nr:hypothetical protein [bacterium]